MTLSFTSFLIEFWAGKKKFMTRKKTTSPSKETKIKLSKLKALKIIKNTQKERKKKLPLKLCVHIKNMNSEW